MIEDSFFRCRFILFDLLKALSWISLLSYIILTHHPSWLIAGTVALVLCYFQQNQKQWNTFILHSLCCFYWSALFLFLADAVHQLFFASPYFPEKETSPAAIYSIAMVLGSAIGLLTSKKLIQQMHGMLHKS